MTPEREKLLSELRKEKEREVDRERRERDKSDKILSAQNKAKAEARMEELQNRLAAIGADKLILLKVKCSHWQGCVEQ